MACAITGFPAIVANNLLNPMRRLLPAPTMMALSMNKIRNAQGPTPNVQFRKNQFDVER
jgi:hypothetical protein